MDFLNKKECNFVVSSIENDRMRCHRITINFKDEAGKKQVYGVYGQVGLVIHESDVKPWYEMKHFTKAEAKRFLDRLPKKISIYRSKAA